MFVDGYEGTNGLLDAKFPCCLLPGLTEGETGNGSKAYHGFHKSNRFMMIITTVITGLPDVQSLTKYQL